METLILALLATPLVFSLVMAFLPKNTSYNVFAGLNLVSVAAVLVLSIVTTMDMMMTAKMASVAIPISMISGAVGAKSASVTWLPFSIRQYPKICFMMLRCEMMQVRPTKK